MTRTLPGWIVNAAAIVALLVSAALVGGCNWQSRSEKCTSQGGTVETEYETKRVTKNGKTTTKLVTEYECIVNGQEVDEWTV